MKKKGAFTLLEILLVVAAIAILGGIVIFAINPTRQLAATRNAQRAMDVNAIYKAAYQYIIDHSVLPAEVSSTPIEICRSGASNCVGLADLSVLTNSGLYLPSIPTDPNSPTPNGSGYMICRADSGRPVVYSPLAELDREITSGEACPNPAQLRDNHRLADIRIIEDAMSNMYTANGFYFSNSFSSISFFISSLVGGSSRGGTNCSTVTSEPTSHVGSVYGSNIPCPTQSNWCLKVPTDPNNAAESSGVACDSGTVYLRNIPLNNYLPVGTWTTGWSPYKIFVFNNFDGSGRDYFRIRYRLESSAIHEQQSDHFINGAPANCHYDGEAITTNLIVCD